MKTCIHCDERIGVTKYGSVCHLSDGSLYCSWQAGSREVTGRAQRWGGVSLSDLPLWEDPEEEEEERPRLIDTFPTF